MRMVVNIVKIFLGLSLVLWALWGRFQGGSLCLASSVCWSLQCLIPALTQGGCGGYFFRLTCSVTPWEGRDAANNNTGMCSQCLSHTGPIPAHDVCALPAHTAQALVCSPRNRPRLAMGSMHLPGLSHSGSGTRVVLRGADLVWPAFCALPRSEQLR